MADEKEEKKSNRRSRSKKSEEAEKVEETEEVEAKEEAPKKSRSRSKKKDDDGDEKKSRSKSKKKDEEKDEPERKKLDRRQLKRLGTKHLKALAEKLRLDLEVNAETTKEGVRFDITGDDARVYLLAGGRSPQKLDAVQTWLRAALENDGDTRGNTIDVDVEGFRQKREERLVDMAKVLAEDAKRLDREVLVAGLNSFERRIVHRSLDEVGGVTTESQGRGSFRKLRVEPN